ncbi:MAG TPA: nicotinate phosphoribosyltransferase [Spirochaetales bacterium]|nr:nicotinate phosphoribosyltransferase [Spirochaetales bacterium]HRY53594.1 nicotinate phosphoribosyltransferase [Spirochaetia bacterium]
MISALTTDFYELTMAQGYWKGGDGGASVFDVFFRRHPYKGGYSVFAGLEPLLSCLEELRFSAEDLAFLESLRMFEPAFLSYLEGFRFRGDIWAMSEGEIVFPQEPVARVRADLIEAQLIEGIVLNYLNFQSLVATKAARIRRAARDGRIMEFGLRRAQGPDGALSASRAAFVGGVDGTSNALAGRRYGIPVMGTMAHSWVMSFASEREAFDAYAAIYPEKTVYLIDTYDTLGSGIKNAIESGRSLAARGLRFGVRLDSGDIDYLSREVRRELDAAGLPEAFIVVSNELDEEIIERLVSAGTPVDQWGVGTHLVTGGSEASFTGVYKLAAVERGGRLLPTMKFSDNPEKSTNPGVKQAFRLYDGDGLAMADLVALEEEPAPALGEGLELYHPSADWRHLRVHPASARPLLGKVMSGGRAEPGLASLEAARERRSSELARFDSTYLRLLNPHGYKVSISERLRELKLGFIESCMKGR